MSDQPPTADSNESAESTAGREYAERLLALELAPWKQKLHVQAPYRHKLRSILPGSTLEVGCGIGRNMVALGPGSVGVDHNPYSIAVARKRGFQAMTVAEFVAAPPTEPFDNLLAAHLIEHMSFEQSVEVLGGYLPYLTSAKHCVFICPQELGYKTDSTHVQFADFDYLERVAEALGLRVIRRESFPLPRLAGRVVPYNEFHVQAVAAR